MPRILTVKEGFKLMWSRFQPQVHEDIETLRTDTVRDLEKDALFSNYGAIQLIHREPVRDAMTYNTQELASWSSLLYVAFTVWNRKSLWAAGAQLSIVSLFVGIVVLASVKDPAQLDVSRFGEISAFLRAFVGLLLGFFMSASVTRWWKTVEGFTALCCVVRKLHMTLNACDVPAQESKHVLRYGFLSAWILHMELHIQALPLDDQEHIFKKRWESFRNGEGFDSDFAKVLPEEADMLQEVADAPGTLWIWIGTLLGRFAEDGLIRTLAAPSFARLTTLSGEGLDRIIQVRSSIVVQAPYIYVQMLSSLVHINNIVSAISFGMTTGVSFGTWLQYRGVPLYSSNEAATSGQAALDGQAFIVAFFSSCFGPFVYQALLEVSIAIAQPFSNNDALVPTRQILHRLEMDLRDVVNTAPGIRHPRSKSLPDPEQKVQGKHPGDSSDDDGDDDDGADGDV